MGKENLEKLRSILFSLDTPSGLRPKKAANKPQLLMMAKELVEAELAELKKAEVSEQRAKDIRQFCADVLCTGIEGGCVWAQFKNIVRRDIPNDPVGWEYVSYEVRDAEDPSEPWVLVNDEKIIAAVKKIAEGKVKMGSQYIKSILSGFANPNEADLDADDADCVIQVAAFGELVFG